MDKIELKTNDWVRQIRETNYQLLQGKSHQERLAFYHQGSAALRLGIQQLTRNTELLSPREPIRV